MEEVGGGGVVGRELRKGNDGQGGEERRREEGVRRRRKEGLKRWR